MTYTAPSGIVLWVRVSVTAKETLEGKRPTDVLPQALEGATRVRHHIPLRRHDVVAAKLVNDSRWTVREGAQGAQSPSLPLAVDDPNTEVG